MKLTPDPLAQRLARTIRAHLAAAPTSTEAFTGAFDTLRKINVFALEAPVEAGGFDLGLAAGVTVGTELGRRALPDVYGGVALVQDALASYNDRQELAARIAGGSTAILPCGLDVISERGTEARELTARRCGSAWELSGQVVIDDVDAETACCVPLNADGAALLALLQHCEWRDRVVDACADALVVNLNGLLIDGEHVVGKLGTGRPLSDDHGVLARGRLRQAAYLLGLGQGAYDLAVTHARQRRQFDRPIMEFQAISFPLGRSAIALSALRLSISHAAWLADTGAAFASAAVEALAQAAELALGTCRHGVQTHGARGMSRETQMHRYYQRVRQESTRCGSPDALWQEAGLRRLREEPGTDCNNRRAGTEVSIGVSQ